MRYQCSRCRERTVLECAVILGHLKTINFPFGTNGKLIVLGVPIFKNFLGTHSLTWLCFILQVAMLLRRAKAPEVYLQKENEEGFNALVKFVKEQLVNIELSGGNKKKKNVKSIQKKGSERDVKDKQSTVAYQVMIANLTGKIVVMNFKKVLLI